MPLTDDEVRALVARARELEQTMAGRLSDEFVQIHAKLAANNVYLTDNVKPGRR